MAKKAKTRDRADQFLASLGTAGGMIGAPGLTSFGAGDLMRQLQAGNSDEYAAQRGATSDSQVGDPTAPAPAMPANLDAAYLKLNLPGSPLPHQALLAPQYIENAEILQKQLMANRQLLLAQVMPPTGQLPMGIQPPMPKKKGSR
jgi:hypothetical protein